MHDSFHSFSLHLPPPIPIHLPLASLQTNAEKMNHLLGASKVAVEAPDVKVIAHDMQRFAVWFGGSMLAVSRGAVALVCVKGLVHERERCGWRRPGGRWLRFDAWLHLSYHLYICSVLSFSVVPITPPFVKLNSYHLGHTFLFLCVYSFFFFFFFFFSSIRPPPSSSGCATPKPSTTKKGPASPATTPSSPLPCERAKGGQGICRLLRNCAFQKRLTISTRISGIPNCELFAKSQWGICAFGLEPPFL